MRNDIKEIYLNDIYTYSDIELDETDSDRKYYVYEWHSNNGKIFYIGKGTGTRYSHILKEIEAYNLNHKKYKGQNYKLIRDAYGISYSIILSDLTECEALIMETYYIKKYLTECQPLLNQITPALDPDTEKYWHDVHYSGKLLDYFK